MDQLIPKDVGKTLKAVEQEVMRGRSEYPPLHGVYDGYAQLLECVDELWAAVKSETRDWKQLQVSAIQVAAMSVRFAIDITEPLP